MRGVCGEENVITLPAVAIVVNVTMLVFIVVDVRVMVSGEIVVGVKPSCVGGVVLVKISCIGAAIVS